jgi:hypothetical protein
MSAHLKITPGVDAILRDEARRRAERRTNKDIAKLTGLSAKYVANVVARYRRQMSVIVNDSRGTHVV